MSYSENTDRSAPCTNEEIGQTLKKIREIVGISQREIARRSGLSNSTISRIESGKVSPSWITVMRIFFFLIFNNGVELSQKQIVEISQKLEIMKLALVSDNAATVNLVIQKAIVRIENLMKECEYKDKEYEEWLLKRLKCALESPVMTYKKSILEMAIKYIEMVECKEK